MIEALACARRGKLETLVITNNPETPRASLVPEIQIFRLGFTRLGFTPGASAYTYTLAALYEMAAALSRNDSRVRELRLQLGHLPTLIAEAVEKAWQPAADFAQVLSRGQVVFTLGSGPAYGTAHYTMRKFYEICQIKAALLETEEYAHDAFYAMGADTPNHPVCSTGRRF